MKMALDLVGVEVESDHACNPCGHQQVGDQLGGDGNAGLVLAVLPGIAEIGHHGYDILGGGTFGGIHEHQQLEQVFGGGKGGLDDEDVIPADVLLERGLKFTVAELGDSDFSELHAIALGNLFSQVLRRPAPEDLDLNRHMR
jgi:hypothetical protein